MWFLECENRFVRSMCCVRYVCVCISYLSITRSTHSEYTGTEYDDKIVADVTVEDDEEEEQENTALLNEQNEMLQRRLKRLEQQIAIMARSARRSYPREQTRRQEFKTPSPSSLTRSPMMSSVYVVFEGGVRECHLSCPSKYKNTHSYCSLMSCKENHSKINTRMHTRL